MSLFNDMAPQDQKYRMHTFCLPCVSKINQDGVDIAMDQSFIIRMSIIFSKPDSQSVCLKYDHSWRQRQCINLVK